MVYAGHFTHHKPLIDEDGYTIRERAYGTKKKVKVIFAGMGISGIEFAHQVQENGQNIDLVIYEKNGKAGGTWHENKYPGCACDIPSVVYQYPWHRKSDWSAYYGGTDEIEAYLDDVVAKHNLAKYAKFQHEVQEANWIDEMGKWEITIMRNGNANDIFHDYADFFVNGYGTLNQPRWPNIEGFSTFKGELLHTARWDKSIDVKGKKVLVIGIGSSATQLVPAIVDQVDSMIVVARSSTWITSGLGSKWIEPGSQKSKGGRNFLFSEETKKRFQSDPDYFLRYIKSIDAEMTQRFLLYLNETPEFKAGIKENATQNATIAMKNKLRQKPELCDKIIPKDFGIGCRRATPGDGFLEALSLPKTTVITDNLAKINPTGVVDCKGNHYEVDVICCATGFNTSYVPKIPIRSYGRNLQDVHKTRDLIHYLGVTEPETPNYFVMNGPYAPVGHASIIPWVEKSITYILKVIEKVQIEDIKKLQVKLSVAEAFTKHADLFLKRTTWTGNCSSWYKSGKTKNKAPLWPGSRIHAYQFIDQGPRYEDYNITYDSMNEFNFLGNGFHPRDYDGTDTTWFMGSLGSDDKEPEPFEWDTSVKERLST